MGELTFGEKVRDYIGHIGWRLFIWAHYAGDEDSYHESYEQQVCQQHTLQPGQLYLATFNLPSIRQAIGKRGVETIVDDITAGIAKAIRNVDRHPEELESIQTVGVLGADDKTED